MERIETMSTHPTVLKIQGLLRKIDDLQLPDSSRRDIESILVRQATKELDHALPWQRGHGRRTAVLARSMGFVLGLSPDGLHHLTLASLLHDIGLLGLPPHLTSHPKYLDSESYSVIQCHPRVGSQWLEPFRFLRKASVIIAHHHERWDGSGYPYGLRGTFIPLEARVLAIADAFDAIHVPGARYLEARDRVAYRILKVAAGTQFDPELVALLGDCLTQEERGSSCDRPASITEVDADGNLHGQGGNCRPMLDQPIECARRRSERDA
jgi:HD-GYP domain-containing protein (c-di-GMP phosphodiesterase class II)